MGRWSQTHSEATGRCGHAQLAPETHPGPEGPLQLGRADSPQGGPGKVCTAEPWGATM